MRTVARVALSCSLFLTFELPGFASNERTDGAESNLSAEELAVQALERVQRAEDAVQEDDAKVAAYEVALDLARRAVAADDGNANAHFAVFACEGRIQLLQGAVLNPLNLMEANHELDRALELDPNHADALASRGGLYRQLPRLLGGNLSKAEEFLARSIEVNPEAVGARIELAETYRDMGHPERGVELLEVAARKAREQGRNERLAQAQQLLQEFRTAR